MRVWLPLLGLGLLASAACGLRSDPKGTLLCSSEADTDEEPRAGSCLAPIEIPSGVDLTVEGSLGGCSEAVGVCGADLGPEDVYLLSIPSAGPVTIEFDDEVTVFSPTLRVSRATGAAGEVDPCDAPGEDTEMCAPGAETGTYTFVAEAGDHHLTVDSAAGGGKYKFSIRYGSDVVPQDCEIEPEEIFIEPGTAFGFDGSLAAAQGELDGACNAPGAEDSFNLTVGGPGELVVTVESRELKPVLGLRTGCAPDEELTCSDDGADEGIAVMLLQFPGATSRILTVDQAGYEGGSYTLTLEMF